MLDGIYGNETNNKLIEVIKNIQIKLACTMIDRNSRPRNNREMPHIPKEQRISRRRNMRPSNKKCDER